MFYTISNGSDFLEHHGVKGMHWGVRRYQNEDGTLTSEGKKRYGGIADKAKELSNTYDNWSMTYVDDKYGDTQTALEKVYKSQDEFDVLWKGMSNEDKAVAEKIIFNMMNTDDGFGSMICVWDEKKKTYEVIAR